MATLSFKYVLEDSHTFIKLEENGPKVKVVTGEIIELDEKLVDKGRMYMAGFRQLDGETGETKKEGNDLVSEENKAKRVEEEKQAKAEAKKAEKEAKAVEAGNKVPEIVVPGSTEDKKDGSEGTNLGAESDVKAPTGETENTPVDYSTLKQPELKAELEKRGLEVPTGIVSNASLIEALVANDTETAGVVSTETKDDGASDITIKVTE